MHPNGQLLERLYNGLAAHDDKAMAACYHPDATFDDIAFHLEGKKEIAAMWGMICRTDIRPEFKILSADDQTGSVDLIDYYHFERKRPVRNVIRSEFRFTDGLISRHEDTCDRLEWGRQALGTVKGTLTWLVPPLLRKQARSKLDAFVDAHPEYR